MWLADPPAVRWVPDRPAASGTLGPVDVLDDLDAPLSFECPRCARAVETAFYGPCESCLAELRLRYQGERREVAAAAYEPKMNVTPNAVALKED